MEPVRWDATPRISLERSMNSAKLGDGGVVALVRLDFVGGGVEVVGDDTVVAEVDVSDTGDRDLPWSAVTRA